MKRRDEIVVGLFTLVGVALLIASMLWLARGGLTKGYPVYATFPWGEGLKQGQPVLFSGANVGYVDDIILKDSGVVVQLRIAKDKKIPTGTLATIAPYGFFGDKLIALKPTTSTAHGYFSPGDTMPSGPAGVQLDAIVNRVDTIARGLNALIASLHSELVDQGAIRTVRLTARSADSLLRAISRLADAQSAELTKTQETLRNVATSVDSARLKPIADQLKVATANIDSLVRKLGATNDQVGALVSKIDTGNGLASKLLNDREFSERMSSTLARLDSLIAEFKTNPRKFIRLSIF